MGRAREAIRAESERIPGAPSSEPAVALRPAVAAAALCALAAGIHVALSTLIVPQFQLMIADAMDSVPLTTRIILDLNRGGALAAVLVLMDVFLFAMSYRFARNRGAAMLLVPLGIAGAVTLAVLVTLYATPWGGPGTVVQ